jgi:hypothetical protein
MFVKKIVVSLILVASLFSSTVYAAPAKPAPKPAVKVIAKPITYSQQQIDTLKLYNRIANQYYTLEKMGNNLFLLNPNFTYSFFDIGNGYGSSSVDGNVNRLNEIINQYNVLLGSTEQLIVEAGKKGINITDMRNILNQYKLAFDNYYKASEKLYAAEIYREKGLQPDYQDAYKTFADVNQSAGSFSLDGAALAEKAYNEYYNKVQTFK